MSASGNDAVRPNESGSFEVSKALGKHTEEGQTLAPVLQALYDWGAQWAESNGVTIDVATP